jgi:hypothetical protein
VLGRLFRFAMKTVIESGNCRCIQRQSARPQPPETQTAGRLWPVCCKATTRLYWSFMQTSNSEFAGTPGKDARQASEGPAPGGGTQGSLPASAMHLRRDPCAKVDEWIWEEPGAPPVAFISDDVIALGSREATLTILNFDTRRVLARVSKDAEEQARAELARKASLEAEKPPVVVSKEVEDWTKSLNLPKPPKKETPKEALKRRVVELRSNWGYSHLLLSPDATLLACFRPEDKNWESRAIDIWDVLGPESPRFVRTLLSTSLCTPISTGGFSEPARAAFTHSNDLLLPWKDRPSKPLAVEVQEPRSGTLHKRYELPTSPFNQEAHQKQVAYSGLVDALVPNPSAEEFAICRQWRAPEWCMADPRKRGVRPLPWETSGPTLVLAPTNQVVSFSGCWGEPRKEKCLEVWDWDGRKVATLPFNDGRPRMMASAADGSFLVVVSTTPHKGRVGNAIAYKDCRMDVVVQKISVGSWERHAESRMTLAGFPLAARICRNGDVRLVTAAQFVVYDRFKCRIRFWNIGTSS